MSSAVGTSDRELIWFIDNLAQVHIDEEASRGAYGLVELVGREGDMPPAHRPDARSPGARLDGGALRNRDPRAPRNPALGVARPGGRRERSDAR